VVQTIDYRVYVKLMYDDSAPTLKQCYIDTPLLQLQNYSWTYRVQKT